MSWQHGSGDFLLLDDPRGEPLCSGSEVLLRTGDKVRLSHFRAEIILENLGLRRGVPMLECILLIRKEFKERHQYLLTEKDISKRTLFCAGFPCFSVTGLDEDGVFISFAEIVEHDPVFRKA